MAVCLWLLVLGVVLTCVRRAEAARPGTNYDEAKVPPYTLPDPLQLGDGRTVTDRAMWRDRRRPEILDLFETYVYGKTPDNTIQPQFHVIEESGDALGGIATRQQVRITFGTGDKAHAIDMLLYLPNASTSVPVFLGLNFRGNHSIHPDPAIKITESWMRPGPNVIDHRATEDGRGMSGSRWPVEHIVSAGYGLATIYYGDIDPDFDDGFQNGVHPLFYKTGQTRPAPDEWGSIGAWAWGLSRGLDYLEQLDTVDHKRTIVIGHSRLGKAALWAGARDERFAMAVSNNSGCGGAALSRRRFGETVATINTSFPHWFCDNFRAFNDAEDELPVDQHMLIALLAPRPVYIASATEDLWADPRGEFLSGLASEPVYHLFGKKGLETDEMPQADYSIGHHIGYHLRTGKHGITEQDWRMYLAFADRHLR